MCGFREVYGGAELDIARNAAPTLEQFVEEAKRHFKTDDLSALVVMPVSATTIFVRRRQSI